MQIVSKKPAFRVAIKLLTILISDIGAGNLLAAQEQVPVAALLKHGTHGAMYQQNLFLFSLLAFKEVVWEYTLNRGCN
jgi:hypothetical protein